MPVTVPLTSKAIPSAEDTPISNWHPSEKEMEFLRDLYDEGWDEPRTSEKLKLIVENTQGLIDKRLLS